MPGLIWFGLLIPVLLSFVLLALPKWRRLTKWWELAIPFAITVITIIICQAIAVSSATKDKEYWGHMAYFIQHNEPFAYDSECPETYQCGESCDDKGNCSPVYCVRWVHCVENSPRQTFIIRDTGEPYQISFAKYKELDTRWQHNGHVETQIVTHSHGYTTKGDLYKRPGYGNKHLVKWPGDWETSEPLAITHTYENRLQTQSHWNAKITKEEKAQLGLYEYPWNDGGYEAPTILSYGPSFKQSDKYLRYLNGHLNTKLGGSKKVRLWVLLYKGDPGVAEYQRLLWKGANKNEFVVMIGLGEDGSLVWADVMTQSEADSLTILVRNKLSVDMAGTKITDESMLEFAKWFGAEVQDKYIKPDFRQYAYIEVQPSMTAILISMIIIMVVNVGAGAFVLYNPWYDSERSHYDPVPRSYLNGGGRLSKMVRDRDRKKKSKYYRYR